ncbi:MAG: FAD-dependent oxidoreductase [Rhodospirillaceae bacterium]|nr:MAG: FAD-dependent oxidoreductase [Rhodospirillaceae bacterium]
MSQFDERFDFVVAGCGGGSMCAGLVMREAGKSVLILEKTEFVGGTTAKSGGMMWIPNNAFLARDGIEDSVEKSMTYLDNTVGDRNDTPGATRERRLAYVQKAPEMVRFLVDQGIALERAQYWPDYYDERPGGIRQGRSVTAKLFDVNELGPWREKLRRGFVPVPAMLEEARLLPFLNRRRESFWLATKIALRVIWARLTGKHYVSAGAALQGRMLKAALARGVDIRLSSPVAQLIVEGGRVTGVVTEREGKPWRVGADLGVLINAGGFARNARMRAQYQPRTKVEWTNVTEGDTGEMIEEMVRHGAVVAQMEEMVGYQSTIPPGAENAYLKPSVQSLTAKPHVILVDQSGTRYQNEGGSYMEYCQNMLARDAEVPAIPSWAIFDSQYLKKYPLAGLMPTKPIPASWTAKGYLRGGDTIEELAQAIAADPATLRATVERFNRFADQGRDEDFHRGDRAYDRWLGDAFETSAAATLGRIDLPPFYAVPVVPGDVGTYGGVVTDDQARVLRAEGTPIEGLYATGVSTASVMGRCYVGAGASVGPSFTWGYVAAQHALRNRSAASVGSA